MSFTSVLSNYAWPGPFQPFDHQRRTAEFVIDNPRCFVLNDMGTGKTASVLWALDALMHAGEIRRALIVAPLSTLQRVWLHEAFQLLMHRKSVMLHGPRDKRQKLYEEGGWDIGITNFDGVRVLKKQIGNDAALDAIVIDEATAYKNSQTNRFKLMQQFVRTRKHVWLMTGTPCPQEPTDAYGLALMLGVPSCPKFFNQFRRMTMHQLSEFKWVPKPDGYEKAFHLLQPAIRYAKEDCIDLPPLTVQQWEVDLSPQQRHAYKGMQKTMKLEFQRAGEEILASNAADKINKLRQIACGVVRDPETGEYVPLPFEPRLEATVEAVSQAASKAIVVVPFKGAIRHVADGLRKHYTCEVINGDVSFADRNDIIHRFCHTDNPHVLLVHPKVMAHGLTLTVADTMVFYAPIYSNEETQQIVQRINRVGQTRSMTVVELGATALEWSIYDHVQRRADGEESLLEMYRQAANEKA